jgi:hypothetical protein
LPKIDKRIEHYPLDSKTHTTKGKQDRSVSAASSTISRVAKKSAANYDTIDSNHKQFIIDLRQKDEDQLKKIMKLYEKENLESGTLANTKSSDKNRKFNNLVKGLIPPMDKINTQIMTDLKSISVNRKESVKLKLIKTKNKIKK